jgi:hypothetical protein
MSIDQLKYLIFATTLFSAALIAFAKDIAEKYPKLKWISRLWFRILCAVIIATVPYFANKQIESLKETSDLKKQNEKDSTVKHDAFILDSAHKKEVKDYALESEKQITETMAKYGLKYDSATKEMRKIVSDSAISLPDPEVGICIKNGISLDSIENGKYQIGINICCLVSPARNIQLKIYPALKSSGILYLSSKTGNKSYYTILNYESMGSNTGRTNRIIIANPNWEDFYILITGTYTNLAENKTYKVDGIYTLKRNALNFGVPTEIEYAELKNFYKKNIK